MPKRRAKAPTRQFTTFIPAGVALAVAKQTSPLAKRPYRSPEAQSPKVLAKWQAVRRERMAKVDRLCPADRAQVHAIGWKKFLAALRAPKEYLLAPIPLSRKQLQYKRRCDALARRLGAPQVKEMMHFVSLAELDL